MNGYDKSTTWLPSNGSPTLDKGQYEDEIKTVTSRKKRMELLLSTLRSSRQVNDNESAITAKMKDECNDGTQVPD